MSLRDKASRINFSSLVPPEPHEQVRPAKTAPGVMMGEANDRRSELLRENEMLRAKALKTEELEARYGEVVDDLKAWEGAKPMRVLDPQSIKRGPLANRDLVNFSGDEFAAFKQEIKEAGGNVVPIKVRAIANVDEQIYELVYGHRRHQASLETGTPLLAIVDNLDDKAAFEEMERENRGHSKPSPWEQGLSYDRAIRSGLYGSARQCAVALGVDPSNLAKALTLANLPLDIVKAFHSPLAIQLRWGTALKLAIDANLEQVLQRAKELQTFNPRWAPRRVIDELVAASYVTGKTKSPRMVPEPHAVTISLVGGEGSEIGRLKQIKNRLELVVVTPLSPERQKKLTELIAKFLDANIA